MIYVLLNLVVMEKFLSLTPFGRNVSNRCLDMPKICISFPPIGGIQKKIVPSTQKND